MTAGPAALTAVLLSLLAAEPTNPPAQAPVRIAAPGLRPAGLDAAAAARISTAFARELEAEGLQVTTAQEIAEKVGRERQLQLLGCEQDASNCLAEIASALSADAVVMGSVAKIGSRYHANIKVLSQSGRVLAVLTRGALSEEDLIHALSDGSRITAADIYRALGRTPPATARSRRLEAARLNHLSFNVALLITGAYAVEYERVLLPQLSLTVSPVFVYAGAGSTDVDAGFEVLAGARWFPFAAAPSGLWLAGELQGGYGSLESSTEGSAAGALFAAGGSVGYTFLFPYGFTASLALGVFRHFGPFQFSSSSQDPVQLVPRANVGFAF